MQLIRILRESGAPFRASDLAGGAGTPAAPSAPVGAPVSDPRLDKVLSAVDTLVEQNKVLSGQNQYLHNQLNQLTDGRKPSDPPTPVNPAETRTAFWEDPTTEVDKRVNDRLAPLIETFNVNTAISIRERMERKYPSEFKHWGGEIDARMNALHPSYRTQPGVWEMSVKLVQADHMQEIIKDPDLVVAFSEPAGRGPGPKGPDARPAAEQLTTKQLGIAKQWGISPEQYLKQMSKMTVDVPES